MDNDALKVLDKVDGQRNIYLLIVSLAQRCHELNRMRLGGQRFNIVEEAFREEIAGHESQSEPPAAGEPVSGEPTAGGPPAA